MWMKKYLFLLVLFIVSAIAVSGTNCWDLTTQSDCNDNPKCQWDVWMSTCHELNCWSRWNQEACQNASSLNLSCTWYSEGSTGWCESGGGCWNYHTNASCTSASGCTWDGQAYCQNIEVYGKLKRLSVLINMI